MDELKKNDVNVDVETLSEHVQYILGNYRDCFNESVERLTREELLLDVFHETNVNNLGRAMSYLTLVYRMSHIIKEDTVRQAVRLTAPVIRNVGRIGRKRRWIYTEPLFVGGTKSVELMGFDVTCL